LVSLFCKLFQEKIMAIVTRQDAVQLLNNAGATGSAADWCGGPGAVYVEGTFGGATLTLQVRTPRDTWVAVGTDTTFTAAGVAGFDVPAGDIRMAVSGGTPSALYAYVRPLGNRRG
jgi:hypothetical protein